MASARTVVLDSAVLSHEVMRTILKEIVARHERDPYGFDGEEAAGMAAVAIASVDRLETHSRGA